MAVIEILISLSLAYSNTQSYNVNIYYATLSIIYCPYYPVTQSHSIALCSIADNCKFHLPIFQCPFFHI